MFLHRSVFVLLLSVAFPLTAQLPKEFMEVRPSTMGVDHLGNLWGWNPTGEVVVATKRGVLRAKMPAKTAAVDADADWGIATLGTDGRAIAIQQWDGSRTAEMPLAVTASRIVWIDADRVAVAPQYGRSHFQVWKLSAKKKVLDIDGLPMVDEQTPGAQLARATILQYDRGRDELFAFDAYAGALTVYANGKPVRRAAIPHPRQAATDKWLQSMDVDNKKQGQVFRPLVFSYPTLALAPDGTAWAVEESAPGAAKLIGIRRDGTIVRRDVTAACTNVRLQIWKGQFVFFGDERSPKPYCIGAAKGEDQ